MRNKNKPQSLQRQQIFTPIWVIEDMIDLIPWDDTTTWLEPSAGDGAFVKRLIERGIKPSQITAWEIDQTFEKALIDTGVHVVIGDFFKMLHDKNTFDVVIGNPPYNKSDSISPIYNLFIEGVIDNIKPDYFSFIIPSRWMTGGRGLDKFRDRMMNDRHIKKIVHFAGEKEVFKSVAIKGGVNYFLFEKDYNGECEFVVGNTTSKRYLNQYDIILQDNNAVGILEKVKNVSSAWMNKSWAGQTPFGIVTSFKDWKDTGIKCIRAGQEEKFIDFSDFTDKHNIIGKWKVCTGKACAPCANTNGEYMYYSNDGVFVLEPNTICTQTYIVVNVFDTKNEAENFMAYMKTKFFRFMLGLRVLTQDVNKEKFAWVPDQLDYSAPWTDAELYKKYNLSRQEVAYIESKIKAI